jgi:hypothetical protein
MASRPRFVIRYWTESRLFFEQPSAEDEVQHSVRIVAGAGFLNPAPNDYLQRWPVSKRVNSSKAGADDAMLIEAIELATA